ncbi:MAG TPA: hypothetical protein VNO30_47910 [Kofleriaceae bacterium]|nr:hypothetical protein [Kofleriaceae bacterium]
MIGTNDTGGGGDDGTGDPMTDPDPDPNPQPQPQPGVCALPDSTADAGNLAATKAQQCNVPGSAGTKKWYRVAATLPGTMDYVQIELWDGRGAFGAGAVAPGTYPISGAELNPTTCGICVRGLGDKGAATQKEYFATGGTVQVTSVGGAGTAVSVTLTNATFAEIDAAKATVAGGCTATVSRAKLDGTIVAVTGGGGGGGGCPATIGD